MLGQMVEPGGEVGVVAGVQEVDHRPVDLRLGREVGAGDLLQLLALHGLALVGGVHPGERGREMVALDLSEYGDPLDVRAVRVPFSRYLKAQQQKGLLGERIVAGLPPAFVIVLQDLTVLEALRLRSDPQAVVQLAERTCAVIPDGSEGMERLIDSYAASPLAGFHREFYAVEPDPPDRWPATYDRTDVARLSPCARRILEHPNDLLLRPSGMRRLVAALLALGWHPRHAAGLIQSKFER